MKDRKMRTMLLVTLTLVLVVLHACHASPSDSKKLHGTNELLKDAMEEYNTITNYLTRLTNAIEKGRLSPTTADGNKNHNININISSSSSNNSLQNQNNESSPHDTFTNNDSETQDGQGNSKGSLLQPLTPETNDNNTNNYRETVNQSRDTELDESITTNNSQPVNINANPQHQLTDRTKNHDRNYYKMESINNDEEQDGPSLIASQNTQIQILEPSETTNEVPRSPIGPKSHPHSPPEHIRTDGGDSDKTPEPIDETQRHTITVIPIEDVTQTPDEEKSLIRSGEEISISKSIHSDIESVPNPKSEIQIQESVIRPSEELSSKSVNTSDVKSPLDIHKSSIPLSEDLPSELIHAHDEESVANIKESSIQSSEEIPSDLILSSGRKSDQNIKKSLIHSSDVIPSKSTNTEDIKLPSNIEESPIQSSREIPMSELTHSSDRKSIPTGDLTHGSDVKESLIREEMPNDLMNSGDEKSVENPKKSLIDSSEKMSDTLMDRDEIKSAPNIQESLIHPTEEKTRKLIHASDIESPPTIDESLIHPNDKIPTEKMMPSSDTAPTHKIQKYTNSTKSEHVPGTLMQNSDRRTPIAVLPEGDILPEVPHTQRSQSPDVIEYPLNPTANSTSDSGLHRVMTRPVHQEPKAKSPAIVPVAAQSDNSSIISPFVPYSHTYPPPLPDVPSASVHLLKQPIRGEDVNKSNPSHLLSDSRSSNYSSVHTSLMDGVGNSDSKVGGHLESDDSKTVPNVGSSGDVKVSGANEFEDKIISRTSSSHSGSLGDGSGIGGSISTQDETRDLAAPEEKENHFHRVPLRKTHIANLKEEESDRYTILEKETGHLIGTSDETDQSQIGTGPEEDLKVGIENTYHDTHQRQKRELKTDGTAKESFSAIKNHDTNIMEDEEQSDENRAEGGRLKVEDTNDISKTRMTSKEHNPTESQTAATEHNHKPNRENLRQRRTAKRHNARHVVLIKTETSVASPPTPCQTSGLGSRWNICAKLHIALKDVEEALEDHITNGVSSGRLWKLQERTRALGRVTEKVEEGSHLLSKSDEVLLLSCVRRVNETLLAAKEEVENKMGNISNLILIVSLSVGGIIFVVLIPVVIVLFIARRRQVRREEIYKKVCAEQIPIQSFINQGHRSRSMTTADTRSNVHAIHRSIQREGPGGGGGSLDYNGPTLHPQRRQSGANLTTTFKYTKTHRPEGKSDTAGSTRRDVST